MKIIGVMGNSGSGKTTLTEYLETKSSVGVIHVDEIIGEAKKKYFKIFLQPKENNTTENTKKNPKLNVNVKSFFYENGLIFKMYMMLRGKLAEKGIEKRMEELKREGKRVIVIDDWALPTLKNILPKCNHIYVMQRDYLSRRNGLKQRDDLTTRELKVSDIPYSLGRIKPPNLPNVTEISNNGTIEDLYRKAEEEYEKFGELSFDERYSLRGKVDIKTAAKKLEKTISQNDRKVPDRK